MRLATLTLALTLGALACAPAARAQDAPGATDTSAPFEDVDALLDELERAERDLEALWCEVVYDRRFILQGDRQIRIGTLAFERTETDDDGAPERAFGVDFTHLIVGEELREERQSWAFRGRWLVERDYDEKQYVKRELAPPGRSIDPLRLGQGPMPLPIGQRKSDILARYTPTLEPASAGFDEEDGSERAYRDHASGCAQLKLVPRADVENPDEKFREIRLWYERRGDGALVPVLSRTVDRAGDIVFVQLVGVTLGDALPRERAISLEAPDDASWDVRIERGDWDEDLDSVRIGLAPTDTRIAMIAQERLPEEETPSGDRTVLGPDSVASAPRERDAAEIAAPEVSETVLKAIGARYLSEDERAERRVFHGLWTEDDLGTPGARARAALQLGVWDDPSFDDPSTNPLDRAEAMVRRGDLSVAHDAIPDDDTSVRAVRLRGEALEGLGRFDEAIATLAPLGEALATHAYTTAPDIVEASRATRILARLTGENAQTYRAMLESLTRAHQEIDRLHWPAVLAEAQLLESKGNAREAVEAASQVLTMTPASADAWALLGIRSVRGFASGNALGVADRLDALERRVGDRDAHSPIGDLIAARMYLRLNDPELAELRVERVLDRYSRHREALALRAAIAATRYDEAALEQRLSEFDQLSPGHPLALFEAGSALSERRQYALAASYLERAVERMPGWSEPIVELGLMEVQAGRDVIAKDVLERAVELDPFHTRARNSLELVTGLLAEFATLESEHFIVRYMPGPDEILAREMIRDLEAMHDVVASAMEHVPRRRTLVELMPDHAWFSVRITGMPQIHTVAAATGPIIAMEAPKVGKRHTGVYDWLRVARHEYAHTVTLDRTDNRIPLWFTEAAAVEMELAPRDYNTVQLLANALATDSLFTLEEIDLGFIRPEKPSDRSQAYAQANWMWRFIDDAWGRAANLEMMDRFASGQRVPRVLDEMFGVTPDEFMERFESWAWEDAKTWGMFPEPSLAELQLEETLADPVLGAAATDELSRFARELSRASLDGRDVAPPDIDLIRPDPAVIEYWGALHPEHPDVLRLRVEQMLERTLNNPTMEDAELLEAYAAARPTDPLPHRYLARMYLRAGEGARAIPHLEYLDEREVYTPAFAAALARRYAEQGRYEEAMASAERATRIAPFDGDHRELAATVALRMKDYERALHHVEALVTLEPTIDQHKRRLEALQRMMERASAG